MGEPGAGARDSYRPLKALAIVMALLLTVPGIDALLHVAGGPAGRGFAEEGIDSGALVCVADPVATLDRIEEAAAADGASVPEAFGEEVGFLPGAHDVRVNGEGTVVGYLVAGDAVEVLADLTGQMESLGWSAVPLGEVEGATFLKTQGACTWALATCSQVGRDTSVVIRSDCR